MQYGGGTLTILLALQLILRHWNITLIYGLVAFGLERRVSMTNLVDGAVSVVLGLLLIPVIGLAGPVVGSLVAVVAISLPSNLFALAARTDVTPSRWVRSLMPWGWRVLVLATDLRLAAYGVGALNRRGLVGGRRCNQRRLSCDDGARPET